MGGVGWDECPLVSLQMDDIAEAIKNLVEPVPRAARCGRNQMGGRSFSSPNSRQATSRL